MAKVICTRCGQEKEGLEAAPFNNEMGQKIQKHVCSDCWQQWIQQQLMLLNEYRLNPLDDEHNKFLDEEMKKFLNLT
ncbi:MAG: oxidative damage protection protein [Calditrichaeota bacterium]|nr:MAG: oxidative damage protection protein [Calditrichota bacterium]